MKKIIIGLTVIIIVLFGGLLVFAIDGSSVGGDKGYQDPTALVPPPSRSSDGACATVTATVK